MKKKAVSGVMLALLSASLFLLALNISPLNIELSFALPQSINVALVPNAFGLSGNGGHLPLSGFPGSFSPTFKDLDPATIRDAANDPIAAGNYDTVVLVQIDYIQDWLSSATFRSRIDDFVFNGGKLIIWDSECQQNHYSSLVFSHPGGDLSFTADTPGPEGSPNGQVWIVENNTLSTNDTASLSYVNTTAISGGWDIGDANVMQTLSPNWCTDMVVRNVHGTVGPAQTYAIYGHGLTIWNGLDMDWMGGTVANDNLGADNLNYIWFLQLKQDWNPPSLNQTIRTSGITVTPAQSTNPIGAVHTITSTVRDNLANPLLGVTVNFTIYSGPNTGLLGTNVTNANGEAYFSWTSTSPGTDKVNATAQSPSNPTVIIFDDKATKTWIGGHNVAVTNARARKTVVGQGYSTSVDVGVENQGAYAETFDVSLYASSEQAMSEVGLVGYWKFDEGSGTIASDSGGNNNHGTIGGAVWTGGRIGSALQFDGIDDYVQVPDSAVLNITDDEISIAAWVKMLGDGTNNGVIVCKQAHAGANDASYSLDVYPSIHVPVGRHVEFAVNAGGHWTAFASTSALNLSTWNHIVGTYDGSKVRIFINGVLDTECTLAGNIVPKNGPLHIGHEDAWSPGEYFNGTIDEVKIYNRTLSADEIWAEYTNVGLVGYWKFDEGSGRAAYDSSGNTNHGILMNGPTWVDGRSGKALSFDGADDYVGCGNAQSLNVTENVAIAAWVKFNTLPGDLIAFVSKDEGPFYRYKWEFGYAQDYVGISNALVFHINDPSGVSIWLKSSTFTPAIGQWYHVAVVETSNNYTFYINGANSGEDNTVHTLPAVNAPVEIGRAEGSFHFNGTIDEVKVYNRTLSADEMWSEYSRAPVGYWKFDEGTGTTASDSSGNSNHGTLINGPTWVDGKYGKALYFDGQNDYVDIGTGKNLINGRDQFSISAWVSLRSYSPTHDQSAIVSERAQNYQLVVGSTPYYDHKLVASLWTSGAEHSVFSDIDILLNQWTFVTGRYNGTELDVFINGVKRNSVFVTGNVDSNNGPLLFGGDVFGNFFNGTIDDVRIYNRALSDAEVRILAGADDGLVGYWKFDEGTGTAASDSSGNSNHGTLINGPAWISGRDGGALSFDGIDDYVDIAATASLYNFPQMTIEAWINPKSDGGVVIDRGFYSSPYWTISVGNSMGGMRWNTGQTTNDQGVLQDTTNIPYNTWTHIALALIGIDSTSHNATWYINGQKKSSATLPTGLNAITSTSNPLLIGKTSHPMYHGYFNGTIDEIRIYGRALSQNEIKTLADADLVGYWKSDEGSGALVQDSSGSSNNGTLINGPTWVSGRCNKALSFDGVDDRVEVPSSSSLNITDQITIMGWFSLKSKIVNEGKGAGHSLAEKWNVYGVRIDSSGFHGYVSINGDPSAGELGAPIDPSINTWYYVAYTYDGAQSRVYVNGRLGASKTVTGKIDTSNLPLWIGANGGDGQFNGTIDEVRIYDRALSASEIWTRYTTTPVVTQTVTLGSGTSTTLTFTWNTTGFAYGNYTLSVYAWPVLGETNTGDNRLTDGSVVVTITGDVNGDGTVDVYDLIMVASGFGAQAGDSGFTPNADINGDGIIDIYDLILVASHFGETTP